MIPDHDPVTKLRRLTSIAEILIKLELDEEDDESLRERVKALKTLAERALAGKIREKGSPVLEYARRMAVRKRSHIINDHIREVQPLIQQARRKGHNTYRAIANYLNKKGVKPLKAKKWDHSVVRRYENRVLPPM